MTRTETAVRVAKVLRQARKTADLTQQQIAARLGVSLRTVVGWEKATADAPVAGVLGWLLICGRPASDLDEVLDGATGIVKDPNEHWLDLARNRCGSLPTQPMLPGFDGKIWLSQAPLPVEPAADLLLPVSA